MSVRTLCIFGTRPEAIKMAPLIHRLNSNSVFQNKVCVTGQHQQMLDSILTLFKIKPDFNLQVMSHNQDLSDLTARIMLGLRTVFEDYKPDMVLVHGDTTTTFAASLSAFYHRIPVAHVEAGLRTGKMHLPFPEEANRKLTSVLTQLHFAPTEYASSNLLHEGVDAKNIFITGNTVIDALLDIVHTIESSPGLSATLQKQFPFLSAQRRMILVTGHRRESFGTGFEQICKALALLAIQFPDVDIVYPVHLNPNVQKPVYSLLDGIDNIHLIDPVDYLPFVYLLKSAYMIITDSGGIQEEAPSLGKPVLVLRDVTERPEAVNAGVVRLVGTNVDTIIKHAKELLTNHSVYHSMSTKQNPYGDGSAADRIVKYIAQKFTAPQKDYAYKALDLAI